MMVKAATVLALLVAIASVAPLAQARSAACTRPRKNAGAAFEHSVMRRSLRDHTDSDSNTPKFDLGDKPDEGGDEECGEWKVGTATGYSTDGTDKGDKPMTPNDLAASSSVITTFWPWTGAIGGTATSMSRWHWRARLGAWRSGTSAMTRTALKTTASAKVPPTSSEWVPGRPVPKPWRILLGVPEGIGLDWRCSTNKKTYTDEDGSGYLIDVETHACKELWGLEGCQNWLVAPVWYRVCGSFDHKESVEEYDMDCIGVEGDSACEGYPDGRKPNTDWEHGDDK